MAVEEKSNAQLLNKFLDLDQKGSIMAEYIWIDSELNVRSKVRTLKAKKGGYKPEDLPVVSLDNLILCNFGEQTN